MRSSPSLSDGGGLKLNEYQRKALANAVYKDNVRILKEDGTTVALYPFLKLSGEVGELNEKIGKVIRDDDGVFTQVKRHNAMLELGDALWYVAACAWELGYTLEQVAGYNLHKLTSRVKAGTLQGSGDDR